MPLVEERVETFLTVAAEGSFSRAGKKLLLSSVSVMRQIEALEREVGVRLFDRTPRGVTLTPAGTTLAEDAKRISALASEAVDRAREAASAGKRTIRVGTSLLRPCKPLVDLWARRGAGLPFRIEIVPFSDDVESFERTLASLGRGIDCFVGPCASRTITDRCSVAVLGTWACCAAVSRTSPLARKKLLTWDDLAGERLMLIPHGDSLVLDRMREEIAGAHPEIEIVDAPHLYDADAFNECERQGVVMETLDIWADVHPDVATVPVAWDYRMPYGIVYAKEPNEAVARFVAAMMPAGSTDGSR